jgi:hypothetical protein
MQDTKHSADPSPKNESQSFKQNYAGTFVTKRQQTQNNPVEPDEDTADSKSEPTPLEVVMKVWDFITEPKHANAIMAVFTALIFLATGAYAIIALLQWGAMRDSNNINRENMESVQRALVSYSGQTGQIKRLTGKKVTSLTMVLPWQNTGVTPAMNGKSVVSWKTFPSPNGIPDNFTYPDQVQVEPRQFEIPPREFGSGTMDVPIEWIQVTKDKTVRMFIYGWITYDDIFKGRPEGSKVTPRHLSEFCDEITNIKSAPDDITDPAANITWELSLCQEHNCTDDRCKDYKEQTEQH